VSRTSRSHHTSRFSRSPATRILAAVVLSAAAIGAGASPASARTVTWTLSDGFENNPAATWEVGSSGGGYGIIYSFDTGMARGGSGGVVLDQTGNGFTSVGKPIAPVVVAGATWCRGYVWAQRRVYATNTLTVNLEAINSSTWTYAGVSRYNLFGPGSGRWEQIFISFHPTTRNLYLRVSVIGTPGYVNVVNFDDIYLRCTTTY